MNSPIDELLKLIRFLCRCDLEREVNLVWITSIERIQLGPESIDCALLNADK